MSWLTEAVATDPTLRARFDSKVIRGDGCWSFMAYAHPKGYRYILVGGRRGRPVQAHRVSYELFVGPIPDGLTIDHLCHNRDATCAGDGGCTHRSCVRPDHLEAVTIRENTGRGRSPSSNAIRLDSCKRGHGYTPANTLRTDKGHRSCRICTRASQRAHHARKRLARAA